MAPVLRSKSRGEGAKTWWGSAPEPPGAGGIDDAKANNVASVGADDSLSPELQTPPPPPPPRRSLRLSTPSASADPKSPATNPNPNPNPNPNSTVGKRKGRPSLEQQEDEVEEGRCMTLRSGSQIRVTLSGSSPNAEEAATHHSNSLIPARSRGRPRRRQLQQEENEMRGIEIDDGDEEEAPNREERRLSLRSARGGHLDRGKGKLIMDPNFGARQTGDKGKAKMVIHEVSELGFVSDSSSGLEEDYSRLFVHQEELRPVYNASPPEPPAPVLQPRREAQRNRAIELAPKYAFFKDDDAADSDSADSEGSIPDAGSHDWPGPFSTAMKIIEEREAILRAREEAHSSKGSLSAAVPISWTPSKDNRADKSFFAKKPLSLKSLCVRVLAENANEIESLEALPDMVKSMLIPVICHNRKMTSRLLSELVRGSPVELQLSDCSWASDREFEDIFNCCDTSKLKASVFLSLRILCREMRCIT